MKNKKIIFLILIIFLLTSCYSKKIDTIYDEQTSLVETNLQDITNISKDEIVKSINYIKNNYTNLNDSDRKEKLIYYVTYLEYLTKNVDTDLKELVSLTKNYISSNTSSNKTKLSSYLNKIEDNIDYLSTDLYTKYQTTIILNDIIDEQTTLVNADLNDSNMISESRINKAINYIDTYYENPYKNNEVIEHIVYYSLYLSNLTKSSNNITNLGTKTLTYINSLSSKDKEKVTITLSSIKKDQKNQVKSLYNQISN